jgi:hypothetical protein
LSRIGSTGYDKKYFERVNRCPSVAFVKGEIPRCDAFGSGGPFIELNRPCTYEESKECPVHEQDYASGELVIELKEWLSKKSNLRVTCPECGSHELRVGTIMEVSE